MSDVLYQLGAAVIAYVLALAIRRLRRHRFWRRVEAAAERLLADPSVPVEDPHAAAERALVEAQRAQLAAVERRLRNGHH